MRTSDLFENRAPFEPIAIVGMGCRFRGAPDVESFWRVVRDGVETVGEYPGERFSRLDRVYGSTAGEQIASRRGGFLPDLDRFDAGFFGISPREAALLDPQQRLLLEVAWEAMEDAGMPAGKLAGTRTGVYVGLWTSDYESCVYELAPELDFYATTGGGRYPASGRLAYFFDLRGPNLTVDTACSSSLVAVHLACQSLRSGESEMAFAGGVNAILRPEITLAYSAAHMLSPDGRCKFGDASANGYVRSEGAGILLLKPHSRALADGDRIYALIRGSAVNNDGRSSGLLISPSRDGQEAMLRSALEDAGVAPDDVDYIEAHGTGTAAGDPVEIETIGRVMATGTRRRPCAIGSVKTNLGHTESAAGVAGLIKTALGLERGILPASLHFEEPNPGIAWDRIPVAVQTKTAPWPQHPGRRIAGVSGFGITGTNAHIVLESAGTPSRPDLQPDPPSEVSRVYLLSAQTPEALRARAISWRGRLSADHAWPASMADLAFTAATRRTHLDFRLAVTAGTRAELESRLTACIDGDPGPGIASGHNPSSARRTVFVFPGQGGQWVGMGRRLFQGQPVFREVIEKCDVAIRQHAGWSVIDRLLSEVDLAEIDVTQPTLFAVMVALAALWRSWGVEPDAVVGHSMGESAAAAVSGALSIEDAAAVICHRSRLMKRASGRGLMAVTGLSLEEAAALAKKFSGRISVAANNSPTSTVISGDADAIEQCLAELESREVFCRRIKVDVASHSAHMEPFEEELAGLLAGIQPRAGTIPLYSTTSGTVENGAGLNADYWARNLRDPVLFSSAVQQLLAGGFDTFLEINAHPVLLHAIEEGSRYVDKSIVAVASLRRDQDEHEALMDAAAVLFVNGGVVNWSRLYPQGACLNLPAYPWQRERHWVETDEIPARRTAAATKRADCLDHIYELQWNPGEPIARHDSAARRWWLVVAERGLADPVAARMEAVGDSCIRVENADEAQRALESFGALCRGVVYSPGTGTEPREVMQATYQVVRLVQVLSALGAAEPPRLWLLTSGAFQLPGDGGELSVAGSPAWGLARVVAREYPELRSVNVDISSVPSEDELDTLAALLHDNGPEEQIAVRGRDYFVARYQANLAVKSSESATFQPDATYLITGGMGGIGLELAGWLGVRGARHIALLGRSGPSEVVRERIAAIESLGASVRVFRADVSEESQVASALDSIAAGMPQLRGVFHLSVVTDGALLADLTEERLQRVMLPKAAGAWNLHRHLEHTELDFFVMFSSIAAAYSQPGFGSYAAANAFLDSLARYRRANGRPALSIQWCPWTAIGLANDERAQRGVQLYRDQGITPVSAEAACDALGRMLLVDVPVLLVMPARWEQFARSFESGTNGVPRAFLGQVPRAEVETAGRAEESIRETLAAAAAGRPRRALLEAHLQETTARVLKTSAHRIDPHKPLGSMGVDSLMALEMMRRLSATAGVRLPATAVFNYPTIALLSEEIARRMGVSLDGEASDREASDMILKAAAKAPVPAVAEISDEEAIAALTGQNGNYQ